MSLNQAIVIKMLSSKCSKAQVPQLLHRAHHIWLCPVKALNNYLLIQLPYPGLLFIWPDGHTLTRHDLTCMLNQVTDFLQLPSEIIKPHPFRIGGGTYLYICGVSTEEIKCHGHWSTDCFKIYIHL